MKYLIPTLLAATALSSTAALAQNQPLVVNEQTVVNRPIIVEQKTVQTEPVYAKPITDLNLRNWPSNQAEIRDVIPRGAEVFVEGCNTEGWCYVEYRGMPGYAYGEYLTATFEAEPVYFTPDIAPTYVPAFTYDYPQSYIPTTGRIVSPGTVYYDAYEVTTLDGQITDYVITNPVEPVYLSGELAPGAIIPQEVTLYNVPTYDYSYTYINGVPVVVNPVDRSIVYVNY